jgi:hypothetical protein
MRLAGKLDWKELSFLKKCRMSIGKDPRPGRPSTSKKDDHVDRVRAVILGNRCLTVRGVANEVGISTESCHQMFTEGVHRVLVGKPEGKRPLGRPRRRWENNIKIDLQEVGGGRGDWMELAQDRDRRRALVGTVRNFRVP